MAVKRDRWTVLDDMGLQHTAMIARFYRDDALVTLQVATACHPRVEQFEGLDGLGAVWSGSNLPSALMTDHGTPFQIIKYNTRAVPTCLQCLSFAGDWVNG